MGLENKFNDANENAIRGGRAAMAKLETRIRDLEVELGNVQARTGENTKGFQKSERRAKELAFQIDEDKKNQDRMSDLANKLQSKIKTYKKYRGGGGDRRPQPGQVQEGSAGAGGDRGARQACRGSDALLDSRISSKDHICF